MTLSEGKAPAVFIDRDGVICENRPDHVKAWSEFAFVPGSIEALASLSNVGTRLFVVTNQAIVGRGLISRRTLDTIHEKMLDVLQGAGARIEGVLVCPHHPDDRCECRKPNPGLLLDAGLRFKIDLGRSILIGDAGSDMEAGARAGCETVLVRTGRGESEISARAWGKFKPDFIADDVVDAAIWIMGRQAVRGASGVRARGGDGR